jgi:hypothetical protein
VTRRRAVIAVGLVVAGVLGWVAPPRAQSASAPEPVVSDGEVRTLRDRAAAYWAARMAGDNKAQWELLEPRGRGRMTPEEYASERRGIQYLGYQVEDATVQGYFAVVKVRLLFTPILATMPRAAVQTVLMDDQWIRVGGVWYRQLDSRQPERREP